jgi:hypothetical protein
VQQKETQHLERRAVTVDSLSVSRAEVCG